MKQSVYNALIRAYLCTGLAQRFFVNMVMGDLDLDDLSLVSIF